MSSRAAKPTSAAHTAPTGRYRRWLVPPAVGAFVHLLVIANAGGLDRSSMSGILADSSYRLLPA
ncbi:hypothetical protein ACFOW4_13860 [Micromonospora sp. GCM10011542]|uniref:hypothetical protein n=1 Tax=Micromonospora sp. GCM10011542 TaxID=3317337 RepID=UPI003615040F